MKLYRRLLIMFTFVFSFTLMYSALTLGAAINNYSEHDRRFSTKHGELTFVDAKGQLSSSDAVEIRLNGKTLLKSVPIEEHWSDGSLHYWQQNLAVAVNKNHINDYSIQENPKHKAGEVPIKIDRLLVAEDYRGLKTQMIIIDFTGKEPFVSKRFGCNPDFKYNIALERIKWGKKKAVITFEGSEEWNYHYADNRMVSNVLECE